VYFDESGKLITPEGTKPVSDYRKTTDEQIQGIIDTLDLPVAEAMKVLGVKKQFVYDTRHRLKKGKFEKRGFFYPHEEEPVHLSRIPEPPVAEEKPQPEPEVIVEVEEPELIQAPPKESRSGKRWTNEEIEFIRNSTGNDPEWVAEQLNRTVNAVKAARYAIENGSLVEGEERKKKVVTMDTKPRRKFSILWGLISWES
jgi:hypothetical protein